MLKKTDVLPERARHNKKGLKDSPLLVYQEPARAALRSLAIKIEAEDEVEVEAEGEAAMRGNLTLSFVLQCDGKMEAYCLNLYRRASEEWYSAKSATPEECRRATFGIPYHQLWSVRTIERKG